MKNNNLLRNEGVKIISRAACALTGLESINFWGCNVTSYESVAPLIRGASKLRKIDLSRNRLTDEFVAELWKDLKQNGSLREVDLGFQEDSNIAAWKNNCTRPLGFVNSLRSQASQPQMTSKRRRTEVTANVRAAAGAAFKAALISALRHPNGTVDPSCLQEAARLGIPEHALLSAVSSARNQHLARANTQNNVSQTNAGKRQRL